MSELLTLTPDQNRMVSELANRYGKGRQVDKVLGQIICAGLSAVEKELESHILGVQVLDEKLDKRDR